MGRRKLFPSSFAAPVPNQPTRFMRTNVVVKVSGGTMSVLHGGPDEDPGEVRAAFKALKSEDLKEGDAIGFGEITHWIRKPKIVVPPEPLRPPLPEEQQPKDKEEKQEKEDKQQHREAGRPAHRR